MISVQALQNLDPRAWTMLLARRPGMEGISVSDLTAESLGNGGNLTRYTLSLSGYPEETTLIGKQTNATEARFYSHLAAAVPTLAPYCWLSYVDGPRGWVLMDESYNDRPRRSWTAEDVDSVLQSLVQLHVTFWEQERYLYQSGIGPLVSGPGPNGTAATLVAVADAPMQPVASLLRTEMWSATSGRLSEHARRHAGPLTQPLADAARGLRLMLALGGWPEVIESEHLQAAADLLDDPLPVLYPLRQLPPTLLHGNPATSNWQLSLLNEYRLLDWQDAAVGPGVLDLVGFVEQFEILEGESDFVYCCAQWPVSQETIEDSYILAMGSSLGSHFNARATRLAIPAARCLHVLVNWFPRFSEWFDSAADGSDKWHALASLPDHELATMGFSDMVEIRRHLKGVFQRFLSAYRSL